MSTDNTNTIKQKIMNNVFLRNILDDSNIQDTELNNKYWFTQQKGSSLDALERGTKQTSFFIVKKYDGKGYILNDAGSYVESDSVTLSDNITAGLENKHYFFFDDYGNIQLCLESCVPTSDSTSGSTDYTQDAIDIGHSDSSGGACKCFQYENGRRTYKSISEGGTMLFIKHALNSRTQIKEDNEMEDSIGKKTSETRFINQYVYDTENIISQNLKWILKKKNNFWYLLYNPIHRSEFKEIYKNAQDIDTNNMKKSEWFANDPIKNTLHKYCNSFVLPDTNNEPHKSQILDPTCNQVISPEQCLGNSFYKINFIKYVDVPSAIEEAYNKPTKAPLCLCTGKGSDYANSMSSSDETDSFIYYFGAPQGLRTECSGMDLNISVCVNNISAANNVQTKGEVVIQNNCGNQRK